jgi:hypothetical protein
LGVLLCTALWSEWQKCLLQNLSNYCEEPRSRRCSTLRTSMGHRTVKRLSSVCVFKNACNKNPQPFVVYIWTHQTSGSTFNSKIPNS